jgi:ABC-type uncharacterized transport system permease subunit
MNEQVIENEQDVEARGNLVDRFVHHLIEKLLDWKFWKEIIWALGCIILALIASSIIMVASGYDAANAFSNLFWGAVVAPDLILWYATPLILTGLSVALAFKCGLFNIGAQGQLLMGAIAATAVGYMIALPIIIHPILCLLTGIGVGLLYGIVPGLLKAYRGAHEVVTTMMLSYAAALFTQWLVTYPMKEQGPYAWISQTPKILPTARLPNIWGPNVHYGLLIAIAAVVVVDYLINRTVLGYELRAVGQNEKAAEYGGINPKKNMALALGISGGLAGLAGAEEMLGTTYRFTDGWAGNLGWDGITVAVLGRNNPWGCLAAALFFGAMKAGSLQMHQIAHVPIEMVSVIQGLIVLFVAAPQIIDWLAKHGFDHATRMTKEPAQAVPEFVLAAVGLVAFIVGFGLVISMASTNPMLGIGMLMAVILSLLTFSFVWPRDRNGPFLGLLGSVAWLVASIGALALGGMQQAILPLSFGTVSLVLSLMLLRTIRPSFLQRGGEP